MCFAAEADFVSGVAIGAVGLVALTQARETKELPLAVLPLAFGLHQITEGFVWLGLEGKISDSVGRAATYTYLAFAWALLPLLAPLAILLVEPLRNRRRLMAPLVLLGGVVGVFLLDALLHETITARIHEHTIEYGGAGRLGNTLTVGYVIATCGTFLVSSRRYIVWFGIANLAAVAVLVAVQSNGLTSLWCVWAAVASFLILLQLRAWRRDDAQVVADEPSARVGAAERPVRR